LGKRKGLTKKQKTSVRAKSDTAVMYRSIVSTAEVEPVAWGWEGEKSVDFQIFQTERLTAPSIRRGEFYRFKKVRIRPTHRGLILFTGKRKARAQESHRKFCFRDME